MAKCQVFISYRRTGGADLAGRISDTLKRMGYQVFYDVDSMRAGKFNAQIYDAIDSATDVLVILPPQALDRCKDEDDWVRLEIERAIRNGKNIIPVMMTGFTFPHDLPESIRTLPEYEGVNYYSEYFSAAIDRIHKLLDSKPYEGGPVNAGPESDITDGLRKLTYGLYPQALASIEKAMQADQSNPELYYYAVIALLQGKRAFLADRSTIKKVEEYLNVAIAISNKPIYYYLLAYIKYDFYFNKKLRTSPSHQELLFMARDLGVTSEEIHELFKLLKLQRPAEL